MFESLKLLHFNPVPFLLTFVIFATLLVILSRKAWKPILKALDERDESIRGDLDKAEESRKEAERLMQEQKLAMDNLKAESKKIREEALTIADKQKEELIATAKQEAASLIEKAKSDIEAEKQAAMEEVKQLAVNIGVDLARKLITRELNADSHHEVISASMNEIEDAYRKVG